MNRKKVEQLFDGMAAVVAGERLEESWAAAQDVLISIVAVAADDQAHAHRLVDLIGKDLHASLDKNWSHYQAQRAKPAVRGQA